MRVRASVGVAVIACLALTAGGCSSSSEDAGEGDPSPGATDTGPPATSETSSAPGTTETAATTTGAAPTLDSPRIARAAAPFAETPDLVVGRGDDADDVAIHPSGFVIGTSKNGDGGLEVYDLDAARLQWLQLGETNNVDLRGATVVSSNRSDDAVDILVFDGGRLEYERSFPVPFEPYGICLYRDTVIVTANEEERVEQYSLAGRRLRRLASITSQSEGCVADEERGVLYVAEEDRGIWRFDADPEASPAGTLVDGVGPHLDSDVEGLALAGRFLIASSQGDSTYAVYRDDEFVASFEIPDTAEVDGADGTDGLAAEPGLDLLVVHDADNAGGRSSNYKYVRLSDVFRR
jgi:3-phytase